MTRNEGEFDCVRVMRELREKLHHETEGMSAEERRAFIGARAQRFWRDRAARSSTDVSAVAPRRPEERLRAKGSAQA